MKKRMNALDWYHEKICVDCDQPNDKCPAGSLVERNCLLAAILHELTTKAK